MRHRRGTCAAVLAVAAIQVAAVQPAQAKFGDRALRSGSSGREVRVLQRWMTLVGFRTSVDGHFGRRTRGAVRRYERHFDMRADARVSRAQARGLRRRAYAAFGRMQPVAQQAQPPVGRATIGPDGRTAIAPATAPPQVHAAIAAANAIVTRPYRYGGGHGTWESKGYDCSGAVSYALHGAGLVERSRDSSGFMRFGDQGAGQWITIYAHENHAYVVIAGLRFDTSGRGEDGPRWRPRSRSAKGYEVRHPPGL